ncbi:MAG: hypothetical protein FWC10_06715 [Lentimicrobiaceae bacterium]|nr:hypothetical protein [Lentimicrobiaceae bacterium]MCL2246787.1 hypothetical protein [Lentimicrobiaceae bacterium]
MNKLLNTNRAGGFPWNVDTAEALNANARYIESIMDGFNIGGRQAVILSEDIMYIKDAGWTSGKIVNVFATKPFVFPSRNELLNNPGKYGLTDKSEKIDINKLNSDTEVYPECILKESFEIALSGNGNPGWKFFEMADWFNPEKMIQVGNSVNFPVYDTQSTPQLVSGAVGYGLIQHNKSLRRIDINLEVGRSKQYNGNMLVKIPLNTGWEIVHPLTAIAVTREQYDGINNNWPRFWERNPKSVPAFVTGAPDGSAYIVLLCAGIDTNPPSHGYTSFSVVGSIISNY